MNRPCGVDAQGKRLHRIVVVGGGRRASNSLRVLATRSEGKARPR